MRHDCDVQYVPGCKSSDTWRLLNAAKLCQMLRAESDGPSTFIGRQTLAHVSMRLVMQLSWRSS